MLAAFERYRALTIKEIHQLRRNKRLLVQLIIPPTVVLIIFGFALNPEVQNLRTGIVDEDRSPESRNLLSALTEFDAFHVTSRYLSHRGAEEALRRREIGMVIVIPADFSRSLARGRGVGVQVLIDAVNANTAAISRGYLQQAVLDYNLDRRVPGAVGLDLGGPIGGSTLPNLEVEPMVLYNPGLVYPWFFVTGVMSLLIFLNGALVASAMAVREKEVGTIEQLLMSPAQTLEMLLAKTTPVLFLLVADFFIALVAAWMVFDLPIRGPLVVMLLAAVLASLAGTGIGIALATYSATQQQAQLLTFFMMPPLVLLSGAFAPIESMPPLLQHLSVLDPLRYLLVLVRGIALKGVGLDLLWDPLLKLAGFALVLYGVSAWRFRRQLG